jgi:choline-glycine betaine transporter
MVGSFGNPILEWVTTLLLECTFLGFCIVFIGAGVSELRKKKNYAKNMALIITGVVLGMMSIVATILLLQGGS